MRNIPINEAETIFEPFYDRNASSLSEYAVTYADGVVAKVNQGWAFATISIESQKQEGYAVTLERDCDLCISRMDTFRMFASIDPGVYFRVCCVIDGKEQVVMEQRGKGETGEYDGKIEGEKITHYSLAFGYSGTNITNIEIRWMGLSDSRRQAEIEARKSPYDAQWKGCFVEAPQIGPSLNLFFTKEELPALKARFSKEPFLTVLETLRKKAEAAMQVEPEPHITEYLPFRERRWIRDRDMKRPMYKDDMEILAFIGLLDNKPEMLRMACRKMLSVAVVPQWTESVMGHLPMTTWHHMSFTEEHTCGQCAMVLDWAGSFLSSYGKALVHDAMVLKGLPRIESDFRRMEYIRHMNQGIVFNHGRILAYLTLAQTYPRYKVCLEEAIRDEREMVDEYIQEDGGVTEGPAYWAFTFGKVLSTLELIARYKGVTMEEYAWDKLKKTGNYALAMLSDTMDGTYMLPINDAHTSRYSAKVCAAFCRISTDSRWKHLYRTKMLEESDTLDLESLLMAGDIENVEADINGDSFETYNRTGSTSLRRATEDLGSTHCFINGGGILYGHYHEDRGQFVLEIDRTPVLIDRGCCSYSNPNVEIMMNAANHNLFCPEPPEGMPIFHQVGAGETGRIVYSRYENGVLDFLTELADAWTPGIFTSLSRRIVSEDPHEYRIYDDAVFEQEYASSFRLHTRGDIVSKDGSWIITQKNIQVTVTPVNYTPEYAEFGEDGVDERVEPVNSLKLYLPKAKEQHILTKITVQKI